MKKINIEENGIYMQFLVDENKHLSLYNFSTRKIDAPDDFKYNGGEFSAVEVQLSGAQNTRNKHIGHKCSTIPEYYGHTDTHNANGRQLIFTLGTPALEIKQYYQFYDNIKTVSCYTEVKNTSKKYIGLEYISSFGYGGLGEKCLPQPLEELEIYIPHNSWCEELNWRKQTLRKAGFNSKSLSCSTKHLRLSNRGCWSTKEYLPMRDGILILCPVKTEKLINAIRAILP